MQRAAISTKDTLTGRLDDAMEDNDVDKMVGAFDRALTRYNKTDLSKLKL